MHNCVFILCNVPNKLLYDNADYRNAIKEGTCKILANILDNAIEAVNDEKLSDLDESIKIISLDFRHTNNFLMMSLKNPCADKPRIKNGSPETTKRDAKNHGFGLKNVREAAAVYSGELSFECNEKPYGYEFSTELLFPINA